MDRTHASTADSAYKLDKKKAIPWILFAMFFGVLSETVFNVSTPKIAAEYGLSPTEVSWIVTIFIITFSIGTVVYGKLADMYSIRSLITIGLVLYAIGAVVGYVLQPWYAAVITGRAIQGMGVSSIPALIMIVAAKYFTGEDRSKLFGLLASTSSLAVGIGPVVGGIISAYIHWSTLFLISFVPLVTIPVFRRLFPHEKKRPGNLDIPGILMLSIGAASLIYWITEPAWFSLVLGVCGLIAFIWRIRAASKPFIDPALFRSRTYRIGLIVGSLLTVVTLGIPFLLPLLLDEIHGLNTDSIGLLLFPGTLSAVVFGTVAGRIAAAKGANYAVYIGFLLVTVALCGVTVFMEHWIWYIAAFLVPAYVGFSFAQTGLWDKMSQIIPPEWIGVGMGMFAMISQIVGAIGTAAIAQLLKQEWLGRSWIPLLAHKAAPAYGNLFLGLIGLTLAAWLLYRWTFGRKSERSTEIAVD